jgi:hypothetical protein
MPPKIKKEEEIDITQLPPWFPINVILKFDGKQERAEKVLN